MPLMRDDQKGVTMTSFPIRPVIGFGAAFATMATVAFAGMTAPRAESTLHAKTDCKAPASLPTISPASGAERPA